MKLIDVTGGVAPKDLDHLLPRPKVDMNEATSAVGPILARVQKEGASALYSFAEHYDGVRPQRLRVPRSAMRAALAGLKPEVKAALEVSIRNMRAGHEAQKPLPVTTEIVPGGVVYQRYQPVGRVGLYVPGGLAVYPSSVVMNVVAAQTAGVPSLVVASPPQREADDPQFVGLPHPTILAACELLGVEEVVAAGGAQAIAALAYGFTDRTEDETYVSAPVDMVTGPGNIYVAAAKRLVKEVCGIDSEAGTTEIMVVADDSADPKLVAWDLISQAEHDPAAAAILVTDSDGLAQQVSDTVRDLSGQTQHVERIREALAGPQSAIVLVEDLDQAQQVVAAYGPEHLSVVTRNALDFAFRARNAGAVFVGPYSPVALGDYAAGSNHVLPTGGSARYDSGLNVLQFLRSVQIIDYSEQALRSVERTIVDLAEAEGLPAHGQATQARQELSGGASQVSEDTTQGASLPFRPELDDVLPYGAPMLDVPVRLNVNENPFPPSPEVIDSITEAVRVAAADLNRYADRDAINLREELADYVNEEAQVDVTSDQVWAANGSNEIMVQILQAFGGPTRLAMAQWPTYSMYEEYARDTNTRWRLVGGKKARKRRKKLPRFSAQRLIRAMHKRRPAVVFVPNPNNPTGAPVSSQDLEEILRASQYTGPGEGSAPGQGQATLVVVDEAYAEFRDPGVKSAIEMLDTYQNLVVTRTMSKAFAAAGLRLGYMVASPQVVQEVMKVRLPYHLSSITQAAAVATLKHADTQLAQVALVREERKKLASWLESQGLMVSASASNFLMFGPLEDPHEVWEELVNKGVLIREIPPTDYLRVTVGTPAENKTFKTALEEALK